MDIVRPYEPGDRDACLALFESNVPVFFDVSEREGFADFLDEMHWPYQVIVRDGRIVEDKAIVAGHTPQPHGAATV